MKITKDEVYAADAQSQSLAYRDVEIYLKILSGATVPPGVDLEAFMARVDLWERQQIFEIADEERTHKRGSWWWVGLLAMCIYDSWRRKTSEAMRRGESGKVLTTSALSLVAFWSTFLLVIRQLFFPLTPITLQPLRRVLEFTAA